MIELQIESFVLDLLQEPEYKDFYLLEVKHNPANKKVEVFIDSDTGFSLGAASKINRFLQKKIDESGILGEKYILDVSSPGIGKPLQLERQYKKNIGRTIEVTYTIEGEEKPIKQKGILTQLKEGKGIVIQFDVKRKEGKKKIIETIENEIAFENIQKAVVKITF